MTWTIAYPFLKRRNIPYKLVQLYTQDIAKEPCSLNKKYKPPVEKKNANLIWGTTYWFLFMKVVYFIPYLNRVISVFILYV